MYRLRVGYFVTNNIALGVSLGHNHSSQDYSDVTVAYERKTSTFTAGVFGRYYLMPASKFSVFGQLGVNYAASKATIEQFDSEDKYNTFDVAIAPGINYFVSDHFALEATFGLLSYTTSKPDVDYVEYIKNQKKSGSAYTSRPTDKTLYEIKTTF